MFGPVVGAAISVIGPELLSSLAEYRLLFFGGLLLVVLWLAPEGVLGTLTQLVGAPTLHARTVLASTSQRFCKPATRRPTWRSPGSVSHSVASRRQPM